MGKLTKEEIILLFLENPDKLADEIWKEKVPKSDEMRTLICDLGNSWCVYLYAENIDKSPHSDTRQECKNPGHAYYYARYIDRSPHPETRQAAYKDLYWKKSYEEWENSLENK